MKSANSGKLWLVLLVAAILSTLAFTVRALSVRDPQVSGLSAVASCLSGLGALFISVRNQRLDEARREKERTEADTKRAQTRRSVAKLYSAEITGWRQRKDIADFLADIDKVPSGEELPALEPLTLLLQARDSVARVSGPGAVSDNSIDNIVAASKSACSHLALSAFADFNSIPNIWTTQFRREDVDLLGDSAPPFFVTMSLVWTNLTLQAKQMPSNQEVCEFLPMLEAALAKEYLASMANHVGVLRKLFANFLAVADKAAVLLLRSEFADPLSEVKIARDLIVKSREASPQVGELRRVLTLTQSLEPVQKGEKSWAETRQHFADLAKNPVKLQTPAEQLPADAQTDIPFER